MGACSVTVNFQGPCGPDRLVVGTITMPASYDNNGSALTAAQFGLGSIHTLVHDYHRAGLAFSYDYSGAKMLAYYPTGGATAAPTTATAVPIVTTGGATASAVDATTPNITPGVGKQVGNTTNLSGIVLNFCAFGL